MHMRDDERQTRPREQFKTTLCVLYPLRGWRCDKVEIHVEGVHEQITQFTALDDFCAADEVRSTAYCHSPSLIVFGFLAGRHDFAEISEFGSAVCVGEKDVLATGVPHTVGDGTAFATVLFERDHADGAWWDTDATVGVMGPGSGGTAWERGQDVGAHEVRAGGEGGVGGTVVYEEDFPAGGLSGRRLAGGFALAGTAIGLKGLFTGRVLRLQVVDCFFKHASETVLFVERRYDERDENFRRFNICS